MAEVPTHTSWSPGHWSRSRRRRIRQARDDYEAKHHPISPPEPIAAIEFVLEQRGLSRKDLEDVIGSSGRILEVMNKQRPLTLAMIRKLVEKFDLPADVLIRSTGDSRAKRVKARVAV